MSYFLAPWETQFDDINASGNVTAKYFIGDGSLLKGVTYSLPSTYNIDIPNGNITGSFANVLNVIASVGNIANVILIGGNVSANYFVGDGSQLTGVVSTFPGKANVDINGNVTGNIANISSITASVGNIRTLTSGNITAIGQVNISGNAVATFFIGNGSQLTGISTNLPTTANIDIISGNITGSFANVSNLNTAAGNIANVIFNGGNISMTNGTFFGGNIFGSVANVSNLNTAAGNIANVIFSDGNVTMTNGTFFGGNIFGSVANVSNLNTTAGNIANVIFSDGNVTMTNGTFFGGNIFGSVANVTNLNTATGNIANVIFNGGNVTMTNGTFFGGNIFGSVANVTNLNTATGNIANVIFSDGNVTMTNGTFFGGNIFGSVANVTNLNTRNFSANTIGNIANVRFVSASIALHSTITANGAITGGNINTIGVSNIANVRFASGNIITNGQLSAKTIFVSNGISANNMIFLSNVGNINDNNVNSIGLYGSQMRFSTIGGSNGYVFTQYVAATPAQYEVANLNYFGGAVFRSSGSGAFGTQVVNTTSSGFTGSMLVTDSATAAAGTFNHLVSKSAGTNVFRVVGNGTVLNVGGTFSTGADYAEMFEWEDKNVNKEDRRGTPVVLSGKKIRVASKSDSPYDIVGVVSTVPTVIGDTAWNAWNGMYLKDKYGQTLNTITYYLANVSNGSEEIVPCSPGDIPPPGYTIKTAVTPVLNPGYDPAKPYKNRLERPEWVPVGICGKLWVDNSFVAANIVHPSWKKLDIVDDPENPGNASAQVVQMLIGVAPTRPDTVDLQARNANLQDQLTALQTTVESMKKALNL
ncbi:Chlorovirus glycoprotein repeat domain-containing protein [Acanthocystis turfacea Chlorella virus Canal-1]|nr:Chlorovirus glycoprotein repeat domain-containing protein [Acanthocystis turfacea Chlorella virus Canal-1]